MDLDELKRRMSRLQEAVVRLLGETSAQDLAEYGIALAVIGAVAIAAAAAIGVDVNTLWTTIEPRIALVAGAV